MGTKRRLAAAAAAVAALLSMPPAAQADTPGHCLFDDTAGVWKFSLSTNTADNTLTCPQYPAGVRVARSFRVKLAEPNVAVGEDGATGTWTMMYDEGFEVSIYNQKFFAYQNWTVSANGTATSNCGRTNVGFFHDAPTKPGALPRNWGCYYGVKEVQSEPKSYALNQPLLLSANDRIVEDADFAAAINSEQSLWQASSRHAFHGLPVTTARKRAGKHLYHPRTAAVNGHAALKAARASVRTYAGLPSDWDWRNVNGRNFVCPVRDQAQCGSCYTFGSTGALCSRVAIATNGTVMRYWSPQTVVSCSPYSQGCDGGFAYNVFKYAEDYHIPWETCFPYASGSGSTPACSQRCRDASQYNAVTDYKFVGGYYGASTEEKMMREIFEHGPVSVEFFVYPDFMHYTKGIYVHTNAAERAVTFNPWVATSHEVFMVGWGVENGTPYWICQNSWSSRWGESGYFRILRGVDEAAIESIPAAATPILNPTQ